MNKVFKVVYSKSKGCYVVVPETAKNNNGKKKVLASVLAGLAVAGAMGGVAPLEAQAGYDTSGSHVIFGLILIQKVMVKTITLGKTPSL